MDSNEDLLSDLGQTLTCPSCRISIIPTRLRSMCPFCGSFYDSASETDIGIRSSLSHPLALNRAVSDDSDVVDVTLTTSVNGTRLPRIGNFPRLASSIGPLIADGLEVIHTYITGLLFRPTTSTDSEFYFSLPPIAGTHPRDPSGRHSHWLTRSARRSSSESSVHLDPSAAGAGASSSSNGTSGSSDSSSLPSSRGVPVHEHCPSHTQVTSRPSTESSSQSEEVTYPSREKSVSQFVQEVKSALSTGDYSSIHDFYQRTFSSPIELNALLKRNVDTDTSLTVQLNNCNINTELLYAVYDHLDDLPSFITKSILRGIISSLSTPYRLKAGDEARFSFMLLQNPIFAYQSSYTVLAHLLRRIISMSSAEHQLLIHWFSKCEASRFKLVIKRLLQFITIREFPPANGHKLPPLSKSRWWIPCATRVLALLYAANCKVYPNLVSYTEFYNSALDHINLMSEYYRWQNPGRSNKFSYCQYPFILSVVAKKIILQKDSEQQMILNARRSLLNRAIHQQIPDIDVFFLNLNVRRSHLLSDSLLEVSRKQSDLKKKLKVTFVGEPGLDMGGLTKEWFLLLIKQIFHSDYGMFVYHHSSRCYWFSTTQRGNLKEYNLIGVLTGLAVYNSIILDLHFPTACYKKLLSPPVVPSVSDIDTTNVGSAEVTLDDFAEVMPDVAAGLRHLLNYEGNVEEDFCMTFQVSVEEFGQVKTHVLKVGGDNLPVTNENRQEYVQLYMDLILNKAIFQAFKAFYLGFHSVCASNALIMLRPEEVEMLVCGGPVIDMEELRKVTIYDGFSESDPLIKEFWKILKSFSPDLQKLFLRFTTGSDRVPVGGMAEMTFKISAVNTNTDMLPTSHTCFNQLVLPRYKNKQTLREKLVIAISNAEGFGLE